MSGSQSDHVLKNWTVGISIDEHEGHTRAKARLRWRDQQSVGIGMAKLNPADRDVADIGDELAVARALADLARRLMALTAHDIEAVTNQPVTSLK
jgi:Rv2632c-like